MSKVSRRSVYKQSFNSQDERIEIVHVSEGYDGGSHWVKEHFIFIKHRYGAISEVPFNKLHEAEKLFNTKRNPRHEVVLVVQAVAAE